MKSDWLTASSFEQTHRIISAINTLSIHAKLTQAGIENPTDEAEIISARHELLGFLGGLNKVIKNIEASPGQMVMGADPRIGELAVQYLSQKQYGIHNSAFYDKSFEALAELISSEHNEDIQALINCLQDLRELLEQHSHSDVANLLGDF